MPNFIYLLISEKENILLQFWEGVIMKRQNKKDELLKTETSVVLRRNLANEIKSLRTLFKDIVNRYQANLEAEMVACYNILTAKTGDELVESKQNVKDLRTMLATINELKLKPKKGRLKDLRRVDDAVERIYNLLNAK